MKTKLYFETTEDGLNCQVMLDKILSVDLISDEKYIVFEKYVSQKIAEFYNAKSVEYFATSFGKDYTYENLVQGALNRSNANFDLAKEALENNDINEAHRFTLQAKEMQDDATYTRESDIDSLICYADWA